MYKLEIYTKDGKTWKPEGTQTDKETVLEWFSGDLKNKYIYGNKLIYQVRRTNNYDGTETITVYEAGNGLKPCKRIYTIPTH